MEEYVVIHNSTRAWVSVSIPINGDAVCYSATIDGTVQIETMPNNIARESVQWLMTRSEYTVTLQD